MSWEVVQTRRIERQIEALPSIVKDALLALIADIERYGPVRGNWPNYGKLSGGRHHCHLKKGRPTYVAVWQVEDRAVKIVEVIYAGTHEKAPY